MALVFYTSLGEEFEGSEIGAPQNI